MLRKIILDASHLMSTLPASLARLACQLCISLRVVCHRHTGSQRVLERVATVEYCVASAGYSSNT